MHLSCPLFVGKPTRGAGDNGKRPNYQRDGVIGCIVQVGANSYGLISMRGIDPARVRSQPPIYTLQEEDTETQVLSLKEQLEESTSKLPDHDDPKATVYGGELHPGLLVLAKKRPLLIEFNESEPSGHDQEAKVTGGEDPASGKGPLLFDPTGNNELALVCLDKKTFTKENLREKMSFRNPNGTGCAVKIYSEMSGGLQLPVQFLDARGNTVQGHIVGTESENHVFQIEPLDEELLAIDVRGAIVTSIPEDDDKVITAYAVVQDVESSLGTSTRVIASFLSPGLQRLSRDHFHGQEIRVLSDGVTRERHRSESSYDLAGSAPCVQKHAVAQQDTSATVAKTVQERPNPYTSERDFTELARPGLLEIEEGPIVSEAPTTNTGRCPVSAPHACLKLRPEGGIYQIPSLEATVSVPERAVSIETSLTLQLVSGPEANIPPGNTLYSPVYRILEHNLSFREPVQLIFKHSYSFLGSSKRAGLPGVFCWEEDVQQWTRLDKEPAPQCPASVRDKIAFMDGTHVMVQMRSPCSFCLMDVPGDVPDTSVRARRMTTMVFGDWHSAGGTVHIRAYVLVSHLNREEAVRKMEKERGGMLLSRGVIVVRENRADLQLQFSCSAQSGFAAIGSATQTIDHQWLESEWNSTNQLSPLGAEFTFTNAAGRTNAFSGRLEVTRQGVPVTSIPINADLSYLNAGLHMLTARGVQPVVRPRVMPAAAAAGGGAAGGTRGHHGGGSFEVSECLAGTRDCHEWSYSSQLPRDVRYKIVDKLKENPSLVQTIRSYQMPGFQYVGGGLSGGGGDDDMADPNDIASHMLDLLVAEYQDPRGLVDTKELEKYFRDTLRAKDIADLIHKGCGKPLDQGY